MISDWTFGASIWQLNDLALFLIFRFIFFRIHRKTIWRFPGTVSRNFQENLWSTVRKECSYFQGLFWGSAKIFLPWQSQFKWSYQKFLCHIISKDVSGTVVIKWKRHEMSIWTSFVKIWIVCSSTFKANFLRFWCLCNLLFDLETIGVR